METVAIELWAAIVPIIGTVVSTIMGTALFKKLFPKANSRVVTWIVIGLLVLIVGFIASWLPSWLVLVLGVLAAGIYTQVIKLPESLSSVKPKSPPVGGGGSHPIP